MSKSVDTNGLPEKIEGVLEPLNAKKKPKRSKRPGEGRPTDYDPKYCQEIINYFSVKHSKMVLVATVTGKNEYHKDEYKECANELPFFSGFARHIGVATKTLDNWCQAYPEFLQAFTRAKELQHEMLHTNSLRGLYNSQYATFAAKNITSWRDKVEIDHGITDDAYEKYKSLTVQELQAQLNELMPNRVQKLLTQ